MDSGTFGLRRRGISLVDYDKENEKAPGLGFAQYKGIRIPECAKFLLVESGFLGFGIQNTAKGIPNPVLWNPEYSLGNPESQ